MSSWEFTGATREVRRESDGKMVTVRRIRAAYDITLRSSDGSDRCTIPAGTVGGWIEKEENFPPGSEAWIGEEAVVYGDSVVKGSAMVKGKAVIESSEISGYATIFDGPYVGFCRVGDYARIYHFPRLCRCTVMQGARVCCSAQIENRSPQPYRGIIVAGNAEISGSAVITIDEKQPFGIFVGDNATIRENAHIESAGSDLIIMNFADISGHAFIAGSGFIRDRAVIRGYSTLNGSLTIGGNAVIEIPRNPDSSVPTVSNVSFGMGANITGPDSFLVAGPFRGKTGNLFPTFTVDKRGLHLYIRHDFKPICFDIAETNDLRAALRKCDCVAEEAIPDIFAAYGYARARLMDRQ